MKKKNSKNYLKKVNSDKSHYFINIQMSEKNMKVILGKNKSKFKHFRFSEFRGKKVHFEKKSDLWKKTFWISEPPT